MPGPVVITKIDLPLTEPVVTGPARANPLRRSVGVEVQLELEAEILDMADPVASLTARGGSSPPEQPGPDTTLVVGLGGTGKIVTEGEQAVGRRHPGPGWDVAIPHGGVGKVISGDWGCVGWTLVVSHRTAR